MPMPLPSDFTPRSRQRAVQLDWDTLVRENPNGCYLVSGQDFPVSANVSTLVQQGRKALAEHGYAVGLYEKEHIYVTPLDDEDDE